MKTLILVLFLLFAINAFSSTKCYIINESKIEWRTQPAKGALNEACPEPDKNPRLEEITYQKFNQIACVDKQDCYSKLVGLCEDSFGNTIGRSIVASDFSESYCVKPILDPTKRAAKLSADAAKKIEVDNAQIAIQSAKSNIKSKKLNIDKMTLPELKDLIKDILIVIGE